jgi:hypothetical protein
MKTRIIRKIGVLATLLCLALLGCDMGNTSHDARPTEAKGAVRVIVGTDAEGAAQAASRTVVPANPEFTYTLSFSAAGRPPVTAALDGSAGEVTLTTGAWTLSVTGKKNGETVAESDPVDVTVSEEGTTVSVIVHPTLDGAKGTFSYAVSADAALSEVSAVLTPLNVGNAEQSALTLPLEPAAVQSVAAGYYRLTVRALKGVQPLVRRETVHIYSSTETYKSYTLTTGDFAAVIYLGGVLSGGIAGYTPVAVAAYEDAAGSVPIDESAVSEGWRLAVEDTLGTVYFKVRLEKDGETYYSKLVTVSDIPASGRLDIDLAIEGYTLTFDASGGTFENGDTVMTLTAPENGMLTLPSVTQSGREFAGWYSAGVRFTAETRISGDTALYAGWLLGSADIAAYLANAEGGESTANPVLLLLSMDLANGGWESLLAILAGAGKYVSLDLSVCTMDGTEFVPVSGAGATKVAVLVLPDAAKSVPAGTSSKAPFEAFTALGSLSGAGVETIGAYALSYCYSLTTVSLPAATSIGAYAFSYCTSLATVSLPAATNIGTYAFSDGCTSLTTVYLTAATDIGESAFRNCTSLAAVNLPAAQTIGKAAFLNCTSLASMSLPVVTTIVNGSTYGNYGSVSYSEGAFRGCTSLVSMSLPMATSIGDVAFSECTSLAAVSLPMATSIGTSAFRGCTSLTSVSLPVAQTISSNYYSNNYEGAFRGCTSLASVDLPAATSIGAYAFLGCTSLTAVSLPAATSIDTTAFAGCTSLAAVSLPMATSIGTSAFSECTSLAAVSLPARPPSLGSGIFSDTGSSGTITISVPAGAVSAYTSAWGVSANASANSNSKYGGNYYNHKAVLITDAAPLTGLDGLANAPGGATADNPVSLALSGSFTNDRWTVTLAAIAGAGKYVSLDLSACTMTETEFAPGTSTTGASRVTALVLPNAAKSVPAGTSSSAAFSAFTALESLSGAGVETIGEYAFYHTSLESVSLPAATDIGEYAFRDCASLTSVSLPLVTSIPSGSTYSNSGTTYYRGTFSGCTNLTAVDLPAAPTIGSYAFYGCTSLESVSLPVATDIGGSVFYGCTSLTEVNLPAAQTIGASVFQGCASLTSVSLPLVTSIPSGSTYSSSGTTYYSGTFYGCTSLTEVDLPTATYIGGGAFYGCTSLASVSLPMAQTIATYTYSNYSYTNTVGAFYDCTSLTEVSLPATPPAISSIFSYTGSSGTITVSVPTGAISAYTSAWGVSVSTSAGGNTNRYGSSHKAVLIMDAALLTELAGLADAPGGDTADNPVSLALSSSFTNDSWAATLAAIAVAGKYVSLDLSACAMTETEFDPGTAGAGANKVTALVLPDAAKSVQAFGAFTALESLSGAGIETIGDGAFSGYTSLTSVSLPAAQTVGTQAFSGCTSLTSMSLPAATTIGSSAFSGTSLAGVNLPAAQTIGSFAFSNTSLAGVNLPVAQTIGEYAFGGCTNLAMVSLPAMPPAIGGSIFGGTGYSSSATITIRVPAGAVSAYTSAWGVNERTSAYGSTSNSKYGSSHKAVLITDAAPLTGLDGLANAPGGDTAANPVSLTLSGSFTNGSWALTLAAIAEAGKYVSLDLSACTMTETVFAPGPNAGANGVTALILPNAAKSIPAGDSSYAAFSAFTALRSISGAGVETIGVYAFRDCTSLASVSLPAATTIGSSAFYQCTRLTSVSLPAATTIDREAFGGCTSLTSVSLPVATSIGAYAFRDCTSLTEVNLPAVTTIVNGYRVSFGTAYFEGAFSGCTSLTTVSLPAAIDIGGAAFYNCTSLASASLPMAETIGNSTFRGCMSLATVNLPVAQTIGEYAFSGCTSLTAVSLPMATSIPREAFSDCTSLTTVSLSAAQTFDYGVFSNCSSLATVSLPATPPSIYTWSSGGMFSSTSSGGGTITVSVPAGAVSAYTSTWGVDASTDAGGNTSKYGTDHKAVLITDAAQ